ncbi:MAG: penicillin-binding protein 2 [Campylobacteraceae bacterium]|nr:penicillin-binding protein 2 [Campylobacteraceae bacterium]
MKNTEADKKKAKILFLFIIISFGFFIFLGTLFYWAKIDRRLPKLQTSETNTALRGNILSADGYTIATSKKLYKVMIDTRNINPNKLDVFVNLYSIYSGDKPEKIKSMLQRHKGNVILSYKLDAKKAKYIQELSRKFYNMKVFIPYKDPNTGVAYLRGMNVAESGEKRMYPNKDIFSPFVGYIRKIEKNEITKVTGVKGIERSYNSRLNPIQDALIVGPKDIGRNVILNRNSQAKKRIDGFNVVLSISMKLQRAVERILDKYKQELQAKEVVAGIMKSDTGEFLALASSNRFDPDNIKRYQYTYLNPSITEYSYEPGSVIKPITLAILLREDKVSPYELVNTHKGRYKLGKTLIRDSHPYTYLTAEDIIVHSSNIGILQLAQRLDPRQYHQGLRDFGFSLPTGIDLPYEHRGSIPSLKRFRSNIYKATVAYGYGMQATFMQLLKAYNVFNDKGRLITPYIGVYLIDENGQKRYMPQPPQTQVLPVAIAQRMKKILIKTVKKGTGKNADVEGLEIGGKTGTAHIAVNKTYKKLYNGSFIGFANDKKNNFTIGVWTREPTKKYHYFGSQSAAPIFKQIVLAMVQENYLIPEIKDDTKINNP